MKKFAFYVSNRGTRLKKFLKKYAHHKIVNQIEFVFIDNCVNKELRELCNRQKISYYELDIQNISNKNVYISDLFLEYLNKHKVDNAFVFADRILVGDLLIKYKNKLINFHPSILPSHKGLYAIDKALKANTFLLGNTAHFITEELDGGAIIMQNIVPAINFSSYDDILDNQLIMVLQLMYWINDNRIIYKHNKVLINNAKYKVKEFIPNIEI